MKNLPYRLKIGAGVAATVAALAFTAGGCELLTKPDRNRIPGEGGSAVNTTTSQGGGGMGGSGGTPECTAANVDDTCGTDTACSEFSCELGACQTAHAALGTQCAEDGGVVCDGAGKCVKAHCTDKQQDADETDTDCGGATCRACINGLNCLANGDCLSGYCSPALGGAGGAGGNGGTGGTGGAGGTGGSVIAFGVCAPCSASGQCNEENYCDSSTKNCVKDKAQGDPCNEDEQCPGDHCVDEVCCDGACTAACSACSVALGAATNGSCAAAAVKGAQPLQDLGGCDDTNGMCGAAKKCACDATGACKLKQGEGCTLDADCATGFCTDGVCCNTQCDGACAACSTALGATTNGTCTANAVKATTDDNCDATAGSCQGGVKCTCDAGGACKGDLGAAITDASKCASTFSVDGVCCASACTAECSKCDALGACNKIGSVGGTQDDTCDDDTKSGVCDNPPCSCKLGGTCVGKLGSATGTDGTHCLSGFAKDGRCCDTACSGACLSCNNALGSCTTVMSATDSDTCDSDSFSAIAASAPAKCDATGTCKGELGATCAAGNVCNSGFCPVDDGRCCNVACNGVCESCASGSCLQLNGVVDPGKCDMMNGMGVESCVSPPCGCTNGVCTDI